MDTIQVYLVGLALIILAMVILWLISLREKDASIADVFWGFGFIMLASVYFVLSPGFFGRKILICALVALWGLRLGVHLWIRNRHQGEDFRYQAWREQAGKNFWWVSLFSVFLLQAVLLWLISAPLLAAQTSQLSEHWTRWDVIGTLVWLMGFSFETIGDWQLSRFKRNLENRGKVYKEGLWRWTRHPNYFGEAVLWWGYFMIALSTEIGVWTVYSPILMSWLLLRVSGVTKLEKSLVEHKPDYADYVKQTSAFIPWFPKGG
jgi:steroid 5-alpha reductase family enzyme